LSSFILRAKDRVRIDSEGRDCFAINCCSHCGPSLSWNKNDKKVWIGVTQASQHVVNAGRGFTVQSDPAIAMMIVEKIAKGFAANLKAQMPSTANFGRGLR
jgi:hypothetical protein